MTSQPTIVPTNLHELFHRRKYVPKGRAPMTAEQRERTARSIRRSPITAALNSREISVQCGNLERVALIDAILAERTEIERRLNAERKEQRPFQLRKLDIPDTWRPAAEVIAKEQGTTVKEMLSGYSGRRVYPARCAFWHHLRHVRGVSYSEIGRRTGGYDHSSVWYGVRKWENHMSKNTGITNG
jgi:chromosomal replication initiation ATPase DnaA